MLRSIFSNKIGYQRFGIRYFRINANPIIYEFNKNIDKNTGLKFYKFWNDYKIGELEYKKRCHEELVALTKQNPDHLGIILRDSYFVITVDESLKTAVFRFVPGHICAFYIDESGQLENSSIISFSAAINEFRKKLEKLKIEVQDLFSQENLKNVQSNFNMELLSAEYGTFQTIFTGTLEYDLKKILDSYYIRRDRKDFEHMIIAFIPISSVWGNKNILQKKIKEINDYFAIRYEEKKETFVAVEYRLCNGQKIYNDNKLDYQNCINAVKALFNLGISTLCSPSTQSSFMSIIKYITDLSEKEIKDFYNQNKLGNVNKRATITYHYLNKEQRSWVEEYEGIDQYKIKNNLNIPDRKTFKINSFKINY